jgi:histidine triad (HIT) family protein
MNGGFPMDCIFCKIANGELPADIVYQDDQMVVFRDLNPQSPVHVLAIPRKHIPSVCDLSEEDRELMGHMMVKTPEITRILGLDSSGVRIVTNCGSEAGQSVFHIHFHILGGRVMNWPPG